MRITTQLLNSLADAFTAPLLLAVGLAILIGLLRLSSVGRLLMKRGRRPLVIQVEYGAAGIEGGENYGVLDARLLSYLCFDGLGSYVIAPGANGAAAPSVAAESLEPVSALMRFAFPVESAYRVDVTWPGKSGDDEMLRATLRISRTPGDRIMASRSFAEETTQALVEAIGSYCVIFLFSQPSILRSTPRWERWNQDYIGYLHYRLGLRVERRDGAPTTSLDGYREALEHFDRAARIDPANMLVQLHRGTLLELIDARSEAEALYRRCSALWPEHIEVLYRLCISHKEVADGAGLAEKMDLIDTFRSKLSYRHLWGAWLRTWRPGHWNPGERRYWRSWISLRLWDRVSKRTSYLRAVAIAELVVELSLLAPQRNGANDPGPEAGRLPALEGTEKVTDLLAKLAAVLLRPGRIPATERLLRPVPAGPRLPVTTDPALIPGYGGRHYRRRPTGWLAMFNAACFFSRAIWLPPQYLPDGFTPEEWRRCCAQACIHELGLIHRDPRNTLDPNWMARDPDLEPLRQTDVGQAWMAFIGFRPTRAGQASPTARSLRRSHRDLALRALPWPAGRRARDGNGTSGASSPP
jgi:tetratricopeptide (TPR) repeat protein